MWVGFPTCGLPRFSVLLDFPGFLVLDQPPECYGTWFEFDQLPWSDTLEPTTKVLWNIGVSDQPTSSDTRACAQKSVIDWLFHKERNFQLRPNTCSDSNQPIARERNAADGRACTTRRRRDRV